MAAIRTANFEQNGGYLTKQQQQQQQRDSPRMEEQREQYADETGAPMCMPVSGSTYQTGKSPAASGLQPNISEGGWAPEGISMGNGMPHMMGSPQTQYSLAQTNWMQPEAFQDNMLRGIPGGQSHYAAYGQLPSMGDNVDPSLAYTMNEMMQSFPPPLWGNPAAYMGREESGGQHYQGQREGGGPFPAGYMQQQGRRVAPIMRQPQPMKKARHPCWWCSSVWGDEGIVSPRQQQQPPQQPPQQQQVYNMSY